ncbi:MAG: hypothetical protein LQ352_000104 [Teloschistes flavicans]|nr:MAG: hypothetical protein LQ352_000104 [Teloschistes flavicans]
MGISGLLPLLKSIHKPCNLKKFAGQTIGVDAYGWLHRGTVACAIDLALGKPTTKFVESSMHRVRMLIHFGVIPYMVFDGDYLPSKAATEKDRAKRREESKKAGLELHRLGKISQAHLELQKAVDVTPEMARQLINELKKLGVQYVVAPYEADAQLAYLEHKGIIQGILSEDSDLLVFGAIRLLTKLDQYGDCIEINRNDFTSCREISLVGWTDAEFRRMAILSGCDYLASINKMGLKTAYRLVRKYKTTEKILRMLQFDGQYYVPAGYLEAFQQAELTFLHQRVYCPIANDVIMATKLPIGVNAESFDFLGNEVEKEVALGIVKGDIHPMTKQSLILSRHLCETPKTPWVGPRRQTVGTRSDLKSNKSIDAFFKAKRVPLAELDPNSLTPSPSQQRLLLQSTHSWASSPAPARPGTPRSASSVFATRPSATILEAMNGSVLEPHPPKKRRLCTDATDEETSSKTGAKTPAVERSKFFPSSTPLATPSMKRSKKKCARNDTGFNIWSDDSVEDVMAQLPDATEPLKSSKASVTGGLKDHPERVQQRPDSNTIPKPPRPKSVPTLGKGKEETAPQPTNQRICPETTQTDSQGSTTSQSTTRSEVSGCTSATNVTEPVESRSLAKTLDIHVRAELSGISKQFLYQPETGRCRARGQQMVGKMAQTGDSLQSPAARSMTPLQRLGATALNRSYSCNSSLNRIIESSRGEEHQAPDCQSQPLMGRNSSGNSPSLPVVRSTEDIIGIRGSEDAMVPASEADESDGSSQGGGGGGGNETSGLDLGRFAFIG